MDIIPAAVETFAERYTSPETDLLRRLNRETYLKVDQPHMLSGHLQGQFLSLVSHMLQPQRILELGTYTGYSAICLAQGLKEGGILHTIDINEEREDMCLRYFEEAGLSEKIRMHIGKAADIINGLDEVFDLVFIDADKAGYERYYDQVWDKIRPGGFVLADNVLFHGETLEEPSKQSNNARAMISFCEKVAADGRAEQLLLTLRDGLLIIRKIG
ncbi:O-methyltransferase [Chitinophaga pinensis]|uniref:O-methyltransferase family 3 n=1 Tax=Chitinophaga pinensis (strain ATCC 43595 / DSM 2588 / LMG 13176 / NBRC 15968 / NCIMB 11800 / UQM 2034) TaxID=485918 RepID=A0A979GZY4_CHIPD|nr:O-methyltransferase [Chitinophaga pinensis]ACU64311.1 O-methyltransferase family 3 [Chitinophaga pinensis DSM 2588]